MIDIFFETLFTGRILFLMILSVGVGYLSGANGLRGIGLILLSLVFIFIQQAILYSSQAVDGLIRIGETGAGGFDASVIVVAHMVFHPVLYISAVLFGRGVLGDQIHRIQEQAKSLSPSDLVSQLNVLAGHPELAGAGWIADRWIKMSADGKLAWATAKQTDLQNLWLTFDGEGFDAAGTGLPMLLARIDQAS